MSSLADGKFFISIPHPDQPIEASANNNDDCAVKPVITNGQMKVWSVSQEQDGNFKLVLEDNWYSSNDGDKVVVQTSVDPGTRWKIACLRGGLCVIGSTDADTVWTATKDAVILAPIDESRIADQYWHVIPAPKGQSA